MNMSTTDLSQQLRTERIAVETLYRAFSEQNPNLVDSVLALTWKDLPLAPGQELGPAGIKHIIRMVVHTSVCMCRLIFTGRVAPIQMLSPVWPPQCWLHNLLQQVCYQ